MDTQKVDAYSLTYIYLDNSTFANLNWFHEIFTSYEIKNLFLHTM